MDKKEILKRKRRRNRILKTFVLVIAFVVAIGATFGVTMAYFGGTSDKLDYNMILRTGVYINAPTPTETEASMYVVPSQVVERACQVKVKSAKHDGTEVDSKARSKGLLRAVITFTDESNIGISLSDSQAYFPVKIGTGQSGTTTVANLVQFKTTDKFTDEEKNEITGDGYYYLMSGNEMTSSALMYEIDTTAGEQWLDFTILVSVPDTLGNGDGGKTIKLSITYQVIQSDFYNDSTTAVPKTVANAKAIFDSVKNVDASYSDTTTT